MKSYLLIISALLSGSCFASGWYAGAGVGPDFAKINMNARVTHAAPSGALDLNVIDKEQQSANGVFGTFFLGYGQIFNNVLHIPAPVYLGAELNANLSSSEHKNSNDEYVHQTFSATKYELEHAYGASLLPGYVLNEVTLIYGRLGYSAGNFVIKTTDESLANIDKYLSGFRWGVGVVEHIYGHFSGRMEYSHVTYATTTTTTQTGVHKVTNYRPQTSEVEFSVVYNV